MRSTTRTALTILVVVSGLSTQAALGSPLLFTFEGELSLVEDAVGVLDPSIVVGASFAGQFSYDPAVEVDLEPDDPAFGAYSVSTTLTGKVGGVDYVTNLGVFVGLADNEGPGPNDTFRVDSTGNADLQGLPFTQVNLYLAGGPEAFDGDGLPAALDLQDFDVWAAFEVFQYVDGDPGGYAFYVNGGLTSLAVVPEPATLLLLSLAGILALGRRRRHRAA